MPTYLLEFSQDPLSDTTPTYTDITAYFLEGSYQRDGGGDLDDGQAGTASFVLNNIDRRFEPEFAAGAYYPNIRPLRRFRLTIDGDVEFTGFVTSWGVHWPDDYIAEQVTVSCVDGRHLLELEALPGLEPMSASTYEEVVSASQPWGYWRLGEPEGTKLVAHVRKSRHRGYVLHHTQPVIRTKKTRYKTAKTRAQVEGVAGPAGTYKNLPALGEPGAILGDPGTSVLFDRTQSQWARIRLDDDDNLNKVHALTVECWAKAAWTGSTLGGALVAGPTSGGSENVFSLNNGVGGTEFQVTTIPGFIGASANTATVTDSTAGWTHFVGVWDGENVRLYIDAVEVDSASASGTLATPDADAEVWIGRVGTSYADGWIQEVAIYEKALESETILAHYIAGTSRGWAEDLAGNRIADILTHDLWTLGSVQSGALTVQPQMMHGQTMLEELDATMECEKPNNVQYFSGAGNPVYLGWNFGDASPYNTPQATYGENAGEIPYETLTLDYDEEIYNEVSIERDGGETQIASDSPSQDEFRMRRYQQSGLILSEDDDAALVADTILERFKDPAQIITSVTLNGADSSALTEIKAREPGQLVRVKRRPAGGTAIDRVCRIKTKSVTITPGSYKNPLMCTLTLTRGFDASLAQWHLGTVGFSELNTTAVLA